MSEKTVIVGDLNEVSMVSTFVTFADDGSGYEMREVVKVSPGFTKGMEYVLPTFVRQVGNALRRARHNNVVGIAIASAGEVDPQTGVVLTESPSMPGWAGTNLKREFGDAFGLPVSVIGEVDASVLGEARWGGDTPKDDCLVVNVGTQVAGAYLKGGVIQHGLEQVEHLGNASLGGGISLQARAGVPAIIDHYGDLGGDRMFHHDKRRPRGYPMTAEEMCKRAVEQGDELSCEAMRWGGEPLGRAIAELGLDVDEVVLTGHAVDFGQVWADAVAEGAGGALRVTLGGVSDRLALVGAAESLLRNI